jgi:hypothetical protein
VGYAAKMRRLLGLVTMFGCASHEAPARQEEPAPEALREPVSVDPPGPPAPAVRAPQPWARVGGGPGYDDAVAVAVATDGAVWAVGSMDQPGRFAGEFDEVDVPVMRHANGWVFNGVVVKYSPAGEVLRAVPVRSRDSVTLRGVAALPDGGVVIVGGFAGTLHYGEPAREVASSAGGNDGVIAWLDADARLRWTQVLAGTGDDMLSDVGVFADGSAAAIGSFAETARLGRGDAATGLRAAAGGGRLPAKLSSDALVARFSPTGAVVWTRVLASDEQEHGDRIAVFPDASMIVGLSCSGERPEVVDATTTPLDCRGPWGDIVLARIDGAGEPTWLQYVRSDVKAGLGPRLWGFTGARDGGALISGLSMGDLRFGAGEPRVHLDFGERYGGFVARFDAGGAARWAAAIGDGGDDTVTGLVEDPAGGVWMTGTVGWRKPEDRKVKQRRLIGRDTQNVWLAHMPEGGPPDAQVYLGGLADRLEDVAYTGRLPRMFSRAMVGDAQGTLLLVGSLSGTARVQIGERWSTLAANDDGDEERIPSDAFVLSIPAADLPKPK